MGTRERKKSTLNRIKTPRAVQIPDICGFRLPKNLNEFDRLRARKEHQNP